MDITLSTYINIQQTQEVLSAGRTTQLQEISDDNFAFYHDHCYKISLLDLTILS